MNLNKPTGLTSQQAVSKVKRLLGVKKAGHAGTLDPLATGILLVCVGESTKVTPYLMDLDKEYRAVMKLGEETDTLDAAGTVIRRSEGVTVTAEEVREILKTFEGNIRQTPPMFSAIKIGGTALYKLARKGIEVERPERVVTISKLALRSYRLPLIEIEVACSKGTYIRSLCSDIGRALHVGAHITALERTRIGHFRIDDSVTLEGVGACLGGEAAKPGTFVLPTDNALKHLREVVLTESEYARARHGMSVSGRCADLTIGSYVRLKDPAGKLLGIGKVMDGVIKIERILHLVS